MGALIELKQLTKRFGPSGPGGILAVDGLSFDVGPGEVLGFLGPNGAGKSTTMKMVTGYLPPTSGSARVCGFDVTSDPIAVKQRVGYLPEGAPLYGDMTPSSFLAFIASTRGLSGSAKEAAIAKAVARANLGGVLQQPIETLSKGFKRRVGLAQAILHEPDVLILDEPTDGLDPNQKHDVRALIREMASQSGKAIVLSTHILEEVEAVCTRVVLISRGRVAADCSPSAFIRRSKYHRAVTLALVPPPGTMIFDELRALPGVREVEDGGRETTPRGVLVRCTVFPKEGEDLSGVIGALAKSRGWEVDQLTLEHGRMDDVFRALTQVAPAEGGSR